MSYKTEFQSNNTDLQSILDAVNALPAASKGLINFTVTIDNFNETRLAVCESGMTWAEFVNSKFNVLGFTIDSSGYVLTEVGVYVYKGTTKEVSTNSITADYTYGADD